MNENAAYGYISTANSELPSTPVPTRASVAELTQETMQIQAKAMNILSRIKCCMVGNREELKADTEVTCAMDALCAIHRNAEVILENLDQLAQLLG